MDFAFFLNKQINPRLLGPWGIKGTEESLLRVDSSVPLMYHDPNALEFSDLFCNYDI